jgi:hypothetical protein
VAYTPNTLSLIDDTIESSISKFIYTTADALSVVLAAGYITDAAAKRMSVGDTVEVYSGALINPASGAVLGAVTFQATVGVSSLFSGVPSYAVFEVISINATTGAATLSPAGKQTILMPFQLADIAAGTFKIGMPSGFIVTSALFRTAKPASTAAKLATLTVSIGGTPVTGGVIALTTANQNTIGGSVAASAITGANIGAGGTTLEVTASAVTAFIEGDGWVEFTVSMLGS